MFDKKSHVHNTKSIQARTFFNCQQFYHWCRDQKYGLKCLYRKYDDARCGGGGGGGFGRSRSCSSNGSNRR